MRKVDDLAWNGSFYSGVVAWISMEVLERIKKRPNSG
jgi:hypothetical protein